MFFVHKEQKCSRIPDPDFVPQVLHQFDEPLDVARGLHANPSSTGHHSRDVILEGHSFDGSVYDDGKTHPTAFLVTPVY